ncbi:RNA polymerase factor sigma-54 [Sneathiella chinensis]|uniref:RNA polymerase sigma-54 factor n=1 Tax=Sneathiella chinensis TaxID=349750 RepID=A0ABQ5U1B6_9PROT|nr:RNA polymerase factor sigma-54 [Sneathiella chinensis]GLQ04990.1 RNA polymerase sigma-54 factor 2 [Sneathiella chinensis]
MALAPRLEIKQSQQLVMTPQLQQAIKLLQLSNLDLSAFVEQELEKNPLLDRNEGDSSPDTPLDVVSDKDTGFEDDWQNDAGALDDLSLGEATALPETADSPLDTDYDNLYNNDSSADGAAPASLADGTDTGYLAAAGSGSYSGNDYSLENTLSEDLTLQDHLTAQLNLVRLSAPIKFIAVYLIDLVSEAGYFTESPTDIAQTLNCDEQQVTEALDILRGFEPAGVFARDLADCLALQLKDKDRLDPIMQVFLENLPLLAKGDLKGLQARCGVDQEDLTDMIAEIRELDPKPGLKFSSERTDTVIPDVFITRNPDGTWHIELNSETLPKVLVNNRYHAQLNTKALKKGEKEYLSDCLNTANWLVKSLEQRANTILKVTTELVRQQETFFTHGVQYLRPLNLKAIADAIGMHESTVSRVTANKFLSCDRGLFELKYFFTSAINSTAGGDALSAEAVRHKLKQLVDGEKPNAILSDDKIVELMKNEGIDIARRTVAKYRDALKIPSSVERRRQKKQLIRS